MDRRKFLKWLVGTSVTMTTTLFGFPDIVSSISDSISSSQKPKVLANDKGIHIAVLSDLHIQIPNRNRGASIYNGKAMSAIQDMLSLHPDFFLLVGDIVHHGFEEEYKIANQILHPIRTAKIPLYMSLGNHEYYNFKLTSSDVHSLFIKEFGQSKMYSNIVKDNIHLIMLSPEYRAGEGREKDWAQISDEQLRWFDQVLTANANKTTLVFLHQPLNNTVEQSQYVDWIARTKQTPQLLTIAQRHPQIKCWFSGHTHAPLHSLNQMVFRNGIWFVGGASTYYTNEIHPLHGSTLGPSLGKYFDKHYDFRANQNRFVSVYQDKIVIQSRDHAIRKW